MKLVPPTARVPWLMIKVGAFTINLWVALISWDLKISAPVTPAVSILTVFPSSVPVPNVTIPVNTESPVTFRVSVALEALDTTMLFTTTSFVVNLDSVIDPTPTLLITVFGKKYCPEITCPAARPLTASIVIAMVSLVPRVPVVPTPATATAVESR